MQAEHRLDRKALEQAILDHHRRPAFRFLGRLEDEHGDAVEIRVVGQVAGGAEQHGGMAVVAAGVHLALVFRVMREFVQFAQRQRVHVGAQANHAGRGAGAQHADHTGFGDAAMDFQAIAFQLAGHDVGRPVLVEGQFGMGMDVTAQGRQFGQEGQFEQGECRGHVRLLF